MNINFNLPVLFIGLLVFGIVILLMNVVATIRKKNHPSQSYLPKVGSWQDVPLDDGIVSKARVVSRASPTEYVHQSSKKKISAMQEKKESIIPAKPLLPPKLETPEKIKVAPSVKKIPPAFKKIVVFHLIAQGESVLDGYSLLHALLGLGLRYGEMQIFHRYQELNGKGKIVFSLASATEPGVFDLDEMENSVFFGISLFMNVESVDKPAAVFDLMLNTARQLGKELGGLTLLNDMRQPLTESMIAKEKQQIRDYDLLRRQVSSAAERKTQSTHA